MGGGPGGGAERTGSVQGFALGSPEPGFLRLVGAIYLPHPQKSLFSQLGHSDLHSSLSPPVHCERGWRGHSGCTDHAPGPEKQHGRRVSQGRQPGEGPA